MSDVVTAEQAIAQARMVLEKASHVTVFAGAGLSAESGLPTFRDQGGLWEGYRVEDVATPEAFHGNPVLVWKFYAERQIRQTEVRPNPGHYALAEMEKSFSDFLLVTQNVDNLSEAAGSEKILKIHGDLMNIRCSRCNWQDSLEEPISPASLNTNSDIPTCPVCSALARPAIVWFGEYLEAGAIEKAHASATVSQVTLLIGTSGFVSGGYGLAEITKAAGGVVIEINPVPTHLSTLADIIIRLPSAEALPQLL